MTTPTATLPAVAPPRRRRWPWIGGFVLLLFATPFVVALVAGWWGERERQALYAEIDAEDPGWRWHDLAASVQPVPGEPNSADQIVKVRTLLAAKPFIMAPRWEAGPNQEALLHPNARLNDEQVQLLRAALGAIDPAALTEARKLKDMPKGRFAFKAEDNPITMTMNFIQYPREVYQLMTHDAMQRGEAGDHDGAIESCQALINASRSLRASPTLVALLVRIAGQAIAHGAVERALGQGEASEEALKSLQELVELEIADDGLHQAMRGERAFGQQLYDQMREGKITVSQLMRSPTGSATFGDRLANLFPGIILSGYPEYLRSMNEQVRLAKLKDVEREKAFGEIDARFRTGRIGWLTRLIMPGVTKVQEATQRSQAMLRTSAVALAAERYRLKNERWPVSMRELVKDGQLKSEYADPYDGKPLRLKRTATGLVIYSIGYDKTDNAGVLTRGNPRAAGDLGVELWDRNLRRVAPPAVEEKTP